MRLYSSQHPKSVYGTDAPRLLRSLQIPLLMVVVLVRLPLRSGLYRPIT
jgi:hypothetical protein